MATSADTIKNKCQLISAVFDLTIYFIAPDGAILYENINQTLPHPFLDNNKDHFFNHLNFTPGQLNRFPVIQKSQYIEKYILISCIDSSSNAFEGTVMIGPVLSYPPSEDKISSLINDKRAFFQRESILKYYENLPVIHTKKLIDVCTIAYYLINHELLSPEAITIQSSKKPMVEQAAKETNLALSKMLQNDTLHYDRMFEKQLLDMVREGRVEDLKQLTAIKREEEATTILSKSSYIRSLKNHIITMLALVSRAAIEGGLQDELACSLHENFIVQLEQLNRLDEVRNFTPAALYTFVKKVKQIKEERYSATISACKNFIDKHIYQKFSHDDLANHVDLSPKYLSVLFKQEVGISVSEYIQQCKMNEAKRLLAFSKTPISEIASLLQFNDQSYFTRVFKDYAGITPKKYRETYHLLDQQ
ncbi:AraC family transcriptional regulator [Paenibacillus montaniterrae]|uniref:AraC family transcriptional regulator n=1 Tax=Paenibacillus montaniterrae TaxID=429341 RepID=A0A919YPZ4_9BACL|nr:helix-turn-helix domain-containing protein [Paenibacillus montaniterrae]GIP16154.1 AraC family transcriptional regulator [Paenibacillus montaniterrae]